jgi:hypothetical protein
LIIFQSPLESQFFGLSVRHLYLAEGEGAEENLQSSGSSGEEAEAQGPLLHFGETKIRKQTCPPQ